MGIFRLVAATFVICTAVVSASAHLQPNSRELSRDLEGFTRPDFTPVIPTVPGSRSRRSPLLANPEIWTDLAEEWVQRLQRNQMPSDPEGSLPYLEFELSRLDGACLRDRTRCAARDHFANMIANLRAGIAASPGCSEAASVYDDFYPNREPPREIAASYDRECLASFFPRSGRLGPVPPDQPPAIFVGGGATPTDNGALRSIGLIEMGTQPICGALLRNDRTLVTARHCLDGGADAARQAGALFVRAVDGRGRWPIGAIVRSGSTDSDAVSEDWIVLGIDTSGPIGAAETQLVTYSGSPEITLLGHFQHHSSTGYPATVVAEDWRKGLRWPRAGLCQALTVDRNCLQMLCQTVQGFSGTPIFSLSGAPDSPIQVVGFVSRPGQT